MSYCLNPSCSHPKNPKNAEVCHACGSTLLLRNRYHVLGILGKGGFGATFAALDLALPGKPWCVIKQLRPSNNDPSTFRMAKELFEREAETLGRIGNHPQVPRLLDYFEWDGQFYLVQEYIKGLNLHQEIKRNGTFSQEGVKQFLSEILPLLQYIHSQKVIHRDIKPANLIRREEDRQLVLIDFGAVKNEVNSVGVSDSAAQTSLTAFAVGTAGFAPPEQLAMRPVYASDVYSVGVTCVYLLTGKSPKDIGNHPVSGELAWEKWVKLDDAFAKVLKTMLEIAVSQRYKNANEVLEALELVPYSESLAQGLVSHTVEKSTDYSLSFSTTPTSRMTIGGRSQPASHPSKQTRPGTYPFAKDLDQAMAYGQTIARKKGAVKLDATTLVNSYKQGRRDFAQQELNNLNLQKNVLAGAIFHQSKLSNTNFQGCDLSNADFGSSNLNEAILKNANLSRAYLGYADLEGADLRGADLSYANLKYANLKGANFCGANLNNAKVTEEQLVYAKTNRATTMPTGNRGFW